jgi:hypothetical protein
LVTFVLKFTIRTSDFADSLKSVLWNKACWRR